jgi:hypothetical protein
MLERDVDDTFILVVRVCIYEEAGRVPARRKAPALAEMRRGALFRPSGLQPFVAARFPSGFPLYLGGFQAV